MFWTISPPALGAGSFNAKVTHISDGDTITLLQGRTIRHTFTYNKKQSENGAVVKASSK